MSTPNTSPSGWISDEGDVLPMAILDHWGQAHATEAQACFCWPLQGEGRTRHRRMPWESSPGVRKPEYAEDVP